MKPGSFGPFQNWIKTLESNQIVLQNELFWGLTM